VQLHDIPAGMESGADGMVLDSDNRVYIATVAGVQVFDPKGQYLGSFKAGRQSQNLAFSGPGKRTLYMTAREGLLRTDIAAR
jgi:gluconolactonase